MDVFLYGNLIHIKALVVGRVISFCSLGIFLYREFMKGSDFNRIKEIISILIAGTKVSACLSVVGLGYLPQKNVSKITSVVEKINPIFGGVGLNFVR